MFGEIRSYLGLIHDKNKMYPLSSYNKCPVKIKCIKSIFDLILGISTKLSNHNVLNSGLFRVPTMSNRVCVEVVLAVRREAVKWFLK